MVGEKALIFYGIRVNKQIRTPISTPQLDKIEKTFFR
jgi:hypothetical protein